MEYIKILLQQDAEVLTPVAITGLVILNQVLKVVMTMIRVGAIMSLAAFLAAALPHLR